eukprot:8014101-Prorocentrum_lima.AAC.1
MTSSLVGSEMCIRDRSEGQLKGIAVFHVDDVLLAIGEALAENGKEIRRAVSYTHLTLPTICSV